MEKQSKKDLLLEVGCEELPPRFIPAALEQMRKNMAELAAEYHLGFGRCQAWGTPRRLVLLLEDLDSRQPHRQQKVKGPPRSRAYDDAGAPTRALHGFARSQELAPEELKVEEIKGTPYLFAVKELPGKSAEALLPEILSRLLRGISFARPMYWENREERFARPVRWLLAFFGAAPLPFTFAGVSSGTETRGHRLLSPGTLTVESIPDYFERLEQSRVILDHEERREQIRRLLAEEAARAGGRPLIDEALLEEVTFLVEYPVAVSGSFVSHYLELPREVLITTMQVHQRFFPVLEKESGALKPCFIGISNNLAHENVRRGYEKVLGARLADASFFYNEDRKERLEAYAARLDGVIYHEALGTLAEKQERLAKLVELIGERLGQDAAVIGRAKRAAQLCKGDLVTRMVRELPELQGVMGREYALLSGEEPQVAEAIYEHYLPRHFGDTSPFTVEGALLSLADRADTLSGCFLAEIEPTGSQDPYALRRQGLGAVAVLAAHNFDLSPAALLDSALQEHGQAAALSLQRRSQLRGALHDFMTQRLRFALQERGLSYDVIEAVLGVHYRSVAELYERADALEKHLRTDLLKDISAAYNRVANLSRSSEEGAIRRDLLSDPTEKELYRSSLQLGPKLEQALQQRDYGSCLKLLGSLKEPVDSFFDGVMVMVDDEALRRNRLNLLVSVKKLFNRMADFALLQLAD